MNCIDTIILHAAHKVNRIRQHPPLPIAPPLRFWLTERTFARYDKEKRKADSAMNEPYEFYEAGADYVRTRMPFAPQIAVILGSSLGPFAERLQNTVEIDYHEVPNLSLIHI